jgi:hypothetical protein
LKAEAAADMKELAAYTLTVDTLNKVDRAMRAALPTLKNDPKRQESAKLQAELKKLQEKDDLTDADQKRVEELGTRLAALESDDDVMNMSNAQTISQMAANVDKFPPMVAALRAQGLTSRDLAKFMFAVLQAGMTAGLQKSGNLKEIPAGTNPANVKFMIEHEADFQRMQQAWAASAK